MKIYVVRHGQSEANVEDRYAGWRAVSLTALGRQQAEMARENLAGVAFDRVYCSDLQRAKETAAIALPGSIPIYTPALREIGVGKLDGLTIAACEKRYGQVYLDAERRQDFSAFGGETGEEMRQRIHGLLAEVEKLQNVENVALIGHEGTVREMLNYVLGTVIPLEHIEIQNASVSVFSLGEVGRKLLCWNYTGQI